MTVVDIPHASVDLAPGLPSRVVYGTVLAPTEDRGVKGAWIEVSIPGEIKVPGQETTITGRAARVPLNVDGTFAVRLPVAAEGIEPEDWALSVKMSWRPAAFPMLVPTGADPIWIEDCTFPELVPGEDPSQYFLSGAQIRTVKTLPPGASATAKASVIGGMLSIDLGIPQGPQGLPGATAIEGDEAVAGYISTTGHSATRSALLDSFATREESVQWMEHTEFWVGPEGSDTTGDGTELNPYATITKAIEGVRDHPVQSQGPETVVTVRMLPGIYGEPRPVLPEDSSYNIKIRIKGADVGGHPNVPTTQFRDINRIVFWSRNRNLELYLEDIKFVDCATGVSTTNGTLHLTNVHAERCNIGARNANGQLFVHGGIYTDCTDSGVYSFMVNRHTIGTQHAGDTSQGPWFYNCARGVRLQETVTGHVDYCHFEGCDVGIRVNRGANVNPEGSEFYNCGVGILAERNSSALFPEGRPMVFGTGQRRNGKNIDAVSGSVFTGAPHWTSISNGNALSESFIKSDTTLRTVTVTGGDVHALNETLSPAFWTTDGAGGHADKSILFKVFGEFYGGSAGSRRIRFSLNATGPGGGFFDHLWATSDGVIQGGFESVFEIIVVSDQLQIVKATTLVDGIPPKITTGRLTTDMTTEQLVRITATANTGDANLRIHNVQSWIRGL